MSIRVMTSVWDDLRTQAHSELLVLLALADWANDDGYCWPTISALATKARLSERAVQQILGRLMATSRIRRIQGGGRGRANRYQVVTARNGASETVNAIHRKENTESETLNKMHPLETKRVNLTTQKGEFGAPHTSYTRQNSSPTTTNGAALSLDGEKGSSSLVEDLRLTYGLSKSQCDSVVGYVLSHGEEYVRAKELIVRSKPRRNGAGALLAALRDDWRPPGPARTSGLPESQEDLVSTKPRGRGKGWKW
jgi:hypothetical protein